MLRYKGIININDEIVATKVSDDSEEIMQNIMALTDLACKDHGMKLILICDNEAQRLWVGTDPANDDEYVIEWQDTVAMKNLSE